MIFQVFNETSVENSQILNLLESFMMIIDVSYFDGLVQERRNSSVLAMELRLSATNPSISYICMVMHIVTHKAFKLYIFILSDSPLFVCMLFTFYYPLYENIYTQEGMYKSTSVCTPCL